MNKRVFCLRSTLFPFPGNIVENKTNWKSETLVQK